MFIIRFTAALLACVVLSACGANLAYTVKETNPSTGSARPVKKVIADEGGIIALYDAEIRKLNQQQARVEIRGLCWSACTMYLGVDNVCILPTAEVGFHGAITYAPRPDGIPWEDIMATHYNEELRAWFNSGPRRMKIGWKPMYGQELHDRFGYALCDT